MQINKLTVPEEIDVCDFLDSNPCLKEVVGQMLEEYVRASDLYTFPTDVIHAAAIVVEEAGELLKAANDTYYYDCPAHRENLQEEAVQTGAMSIRLLVNIGSLKAGE